MPLYEYRCGGCGETFELLRRFQDADRDVMCPKCQSEEIERLVSAFASGSGGSGGGCGASGGRRFT